MDWVRSFTLAERSRGVGGEGGVESTLYSKRERDGLACGVM